MGPEALPLGAMSQHLANQLSRQKTSRFPVAPNLIKNSRKNCRKRKRRYKGSVIQRTFLARFAWKKINGCSSLNTRAFSDQRNCRSQGLISKNCWWQRGHLTVVNRAKINFDESARQFIHLGDGLRREAGDMELWNRLVHS